MHCSSSAETCPDKQVIWGLACATNWRKFQTKIMVIVLICCPSSWSFKWALQKVFKIFQKLNFEGSFKRLAKKVEGSFIFKDPSILMYIKCSGNASGNAPLAYNILCVFFLALNNILSVFFLALSKELRPACCSGDCWAFTVPFFITDIKEIARGLRTPVVSPC